MSTQTLPRHSWELTRTAPSPSNAARETITLLKNDGGVLPLDLDAGRIRTIAVIGPNANRTLLGGYSGVPKHEVTVLEGIRDYVGDRARVLHSEGCKITRGGSWNTDDVVASDPDEDRRQIAEAVVVARDADVIVLAIGGNEQTSREAWGRHHMGDRTSLDLIGRQNELIDAMVATGKPVIALVFNGRPLSFVHLSETVPAILECWYLGQETGHAVAATIFGDNNPGGKLPITVARSVGHLPVFYNHKPSARRGYLFDDVSPLYPFGFGLSYTTFSVANVRLSAPRIQRSGQTTVSGRRHEHGRATRRRGRASLHSRSRELSDAAGEGTQRLQARFAARRRDDDGRAADHARLVGILRHPHGLCRRGGRVRRHGRELVA